MCRGSGNAALGPDAGQQPRRIPVMEWAGRTGARSHMFPPDRETL